MWDGIFGRRNFYSKCKMALKMIKLRMERIMKKRKAMQKFLKNDIADLLKNDLDYNAYGRAEGLYVELNLSSCYDYLQDCCKLVADNLKPMHKERECPQECRVAVASLMQAAARFPALLELRDLRTMFSDKYRNELDNHTSKEFVEKMKSKPPTMEIKFQLMKDIAKEYSIVWDPTSLEHKLNCPATPQENVLSRKEPCRVLEKVVSAPVMDDARPKSVRSRFIRRPGNVQVRKDSNEKLLEEGELGDDEGDQEVLMDRLLRHYSTKSWRMVSGSRTEIPWENESEAQGCSTLQRSRSVSLYTNRVCSKLPDYDELATRVEAVETSRLQHMVFFL